MVLNVGIVSAFIIYKNRPGAQTRLQKLSKKLKQKPIYKKVLYSYPIKYLFLITIIFFFMFGMVLFLQQYHKDLQNKKYKLQGCDMQKIEQKNVDLSLLTHTLNYLNFFNKFQPLQINKNLMMDIKSQKSMDYLQYLKVQKIVYWIIIFFTMPLIILVKITKFQRIIIKSRKAGELPQKVGQVEKQQLNLFGWNKYQTIQCYQTDKFIIQLCGDDRFTHKNNYYAIKKIVQCNKSQENKSQENKQNQQINISSHKQQIIIRRGNIYQARQTMIYLSHIMNKQENLKIKNAPSRKTKSNIF